MKINKFFSFIVKYKYVFAIIFLVMFSFSFYLMKKVNVNYDMTKYLSDDSDTKKALNEMNNEFKSNGSFLIMVENVTSEEEAMNIQSQLQNIEGVSMVLFDYNDKTYHIDDKVLYSIWLEDSDFTENAEKALDKSKEVLANYKYYACGNTIESQFLGKSVASNMVMIMILAVIVVLIILLLNSISWIEPIIFLIVVGVAIIINMGTNAILPSISFVTQSICAVMQLALAMDYSIVVLHTFMEKMNQKSYLPKETIMKQTLAETFMPIIGSSLTTIAGLLSLVFIHFKMGLDIGITLSKGIIISLITVVMFMPAVILLFSKLIMKTKHKSLWELIRNKFPGFETKIGKMQIKSKAIVPAVLLCLIFFGYMFYLKTEYSFTLKASNDPSSTINIEKTKIEETFGVKNTVALLLPKGSYDKEKEIIKFLKQTKHINSIQGIATINLYDEMTASEVSQKYGFSKELVDEIYLELNKETVKLIDLVKYIKETNFIERYGQTYQEKINDLYQKSLLLSKNVDSKELLSLLQGNSTIEERNINFLLQNIHEKYDVNLESLTYRELLKLLTEKNYFENIFIEYQKYLETVNQLNTKYSKDSLSKMFDISLEYINSLNSFKDMDEILLKDFVIGINEDDVNSKSKALLEKYKNIYYDNEVLLTLDDAKKTDKWYIGLYPQILMNLVFLGNKQMSYTDIIKKISSMDVVKNNIEKIKDKVNNLQKQVEMLDKDYDIDGCAELLKIDKTYLGDLFSESKTLKGSQLLEKAVNNSLAIKVADEINISFAKTYDKVLYALKMFESPKYSRIVMNIDYETYDIVAGRMIENLSMRIKKTNLYEEFYVFGQSLAYRDFEKTFAKDSLIINIVSFLFIFIILLVSFKSLVVPIILTLIIEGAIWFTMAINYFSGTKVYFICYLLVVCIQMGSTIDYGIIFTNNYVNARKDNTKLESLKIAFNKSISTILTSGTILVLAAYLVGVFSEVSIISEIGYLLSKGSLISIIFILFCLPQALVLCDKFIEKGTYKCEFVEDENGNE